MGALSVTGIAFADFPALGAQGALAVRIERVARRRANTAFAAFEILRTSFANVSCHKTGKGTTKPRAAASEKRET